MATPDLDDPGSQDMLTSQALYLHLPWCVRKCPYCDFNSYAVKGDSSALPRARYLAALEQDLEQEAGRAALRPLTSIYFGGGTPSLFTPAEIEQILAAVRARFMLDTDCEISMEANPGTVERGAMAGYAAAGINRVSIGAQSFSPTALTALGRIHSVEDTATTVSEARAAGLTNINIDVMHALPGQDAAGALADLEAAIALEPTHLSWYELTLEPNTVFAARPPANLPAEAVAADIQDRGRERLAAAGYAQYEVSAYARAERYRCRHNLNYWQFGDYVGVGAGAHGKLTRRNGVFRSAKPAHPQSYIDAMATGRGDELQPIDPPRRRFEFLLNALRLTDGFDKALYAERTGLEVAELEDAFAVLIERGLIEGRSQGFRPTPLGRRFLDDLTAHFLTNDA